MKIVIITQDDPFYLAKNLKYLINRLPAYVNIVGCVVGDVSPFGKKENIFLKAKKTFEVFGLAFFMRYSVRFFLAKIIPRAKVLSVLKEYGVPRIELDGSINSKVSLSMIKSYEPDLLVSILGNEIFKTELINLAPKGCINLHTALLPKYRGLMPSFWVLKNQEKETGVSVFFVDEGIDSGPIIVQKRISLAGMTLEKLIKKTKKIGMDAIVEAINLIERDAVELIPNNDTDKTYFTFPTREDVCGFRSKGGKFF
ncbi:formyltransferase family protein [Akkermansiaceae bacterium]|nr:formyltransferase family protein [Akkermansiaceae bacterium]MDB4633275.1 formyltransferase family protein [Akkermansiaceae bacterium]MDB4801548.1 formyltransferase family protein [Akkermansiaceae bacterium]